jgi:carbon storage regulator
MLILTRKVGESIHIGNDVSVTLLRTPDGKLAIGVDAPRSVPVHRQEIYERIHGDDRNIDAASLLSSD